MSITISSVLTMCILNSMLIFILCIIFKNVMILKKLGPQFGIVILLVVIVRMFVPVEPPYAFSIRIQDTFVVARRFFSHKLFLKPFEIKVWNILLFIWMFGVVCGFIYRLWIYLRLIICASLFPVTPWDSICETYQLDKNEFEDLKNLNIICSDLFEAPYLFGVKKIYFILPKMAYDKEQVRYILRHELMHVRDHDIAWKILVDLLCTFFWWNPIFWYLKNELFQLIEIKNDMRIVADLSEKDRIVYMECLTNTAAQLAGKDIVFGLAFSKNDHKELKRRLKLIASSGNVSKPQQIVMALISLFALFMTSAIVFEPYSYDMDEGIPLTNENTFLIEDDGQYEVYFQGEYLFSTDDLTPFWDVKIYKNIEEVYKNE